MCGILQERTFCFINKPNKILSLDFIACSSPFLLFFSTLKSATAAEKIAMSVGKLFCVALNISSAVSTLISFIFSSIFRLVGPDIKVVSKPLLDKEFAISYHCLPIDLFDMNLTGSKYSFVGTAVTNA